MIHQNEHPCFYEGQYLTAVDLAAIVAYGRMQQARHLLGGHTWGIAMGLQIKVVPSPLGGGQADVYLQPGYAWDGFGKPIVVLASYAIPAELFKPVVYNAALDEGDPEGRLFPVWLRYVETATQGPRPGFEGCETEDQFARVRETFRLEVGERPNHSDRHDTVAVGGYNVDAQLAFQVLESDDPLIYDESIPYQIFPEDGTPAYWLIPLGYVRWKPNPDPNQPGYFVEMNEADQLKSRQIRRYIGVVAEGVQAADGIIRLRSRTDDPLGKVWSDDLVWVEGRLRADGDIKLFGGKLDFRDTAGQDQEAPLWIQRRENNDFDGKDLQILLGESQNGPNRLAVGAVAVADNGDVTVTDRLVVQDNGMVGLGTTDPASTLSKPLTIRGSGANEDLLGFERANGALRWHFNLSPDEAISGLNIVETDEDESRLFFQPGGNIGIGTIEPQAKLDIASVPATAGGSGLGADVWLRAGNGGDGGRFWIEYGSQGAPLAVLSDLDDPPRLRFQQTGDGGAEDSPAFSSWIGHARSDSSDLAVMGGNLGLGTTNPRTLLHLRDGVNPTLRIQSDGVNEISGRLSLRQSNNVGADIYYDGRNGLEGLAIETFDAGGSRGVQLFIENNGQIGIDTTNPTERLDVRGNIKLGGNGDYFALGSVDNLRLVAGRVSDTGSELSGTGYTANRTSEGSYTVTFTDPFTGPPIVLVSPIEALAEDNVLTVVNLTVASFSVRSRDVAGDVSGDLQDAAFTFIALGGQT